VTENPRVRTRRVYTGRIINLDIDTVRYPNGTIGEQEMIRHPGSSAVVPFLSDPFGAEPQVLLLRQYRYAAEGFVYEIPAGRLHPGEDPAVCARRELAEEAGCTAGQIEPLLTFYTTPGFTDERISAFMAWDLTVGGTDHEPDEFIEVAPHPLSEALSMIERGAIPDAKTALSLLYVAGFRLRR
jgi:ADP-ribose pyrophosphatase